MDQHDTSGLELRTLDLPGGTVVYAERGEGIPIVAVHGMPGNHKLWREMAQALGAEARALAVNLPGFEGTSRRAGRPM